MSEQNVELMKTVVTDDTDLVEVFGGGIEGLSSSPVAQRMLSALAEDVAVDFIPAVAGGPQGDFAGRDGLIEGWQDWLAPWESYVIHIDDLLDAGDDVVVLARLHGRTRHDQVEMEQKAASLWTIRDGKVVHIRFYLDREEALRDAGLSAREQ